MFLISISIVLLFYYQCIVKPIVLHCKMIYKIQLIGNKQVTLFVKLNR